jgi:hypothetical protein
MMRAALFALALTFVPSVAHAADLSDQLSFGDPVTVTADDVVSGDVVVIGADVRIEGTVLGDVVVVGGDLIIGAGGRISGDAVPVGGALVQSTGAEVLGASIEVDVDVPGAAAIASLAGHEAAAMPSPRRTEAMSRVVGLGAGTAALAFILVLGLLFQSAWPERSRNLRRTLEASPGESLLIGTLVSAMAMLFSMFLTITVVGMVALPAVAFAAGALWLLGFTALCEALGDRLPLPAALRSRTGSFVVGLLALSAVGALGFLGLPGAALSALIGGVTGSAAVGAAVLSRLGRRPFPA